MKKILICTIMVLILSSIVFAGVTNPLPTELNLLKGESGRFKFQVQTITSDQEVECTSSLSEESIFTIDFDPSTITVPAGTVRDIYGTINVPKNLEYGTYEETFCLSCKPTQSSEGAAVLIETCNLPIKVNVVSERTRDNMYIPPKPFPLYGKVLIGIGGLALIAAIIYLLERKKKTAKQKTKKKVVKRKKRK